MLRRRGGREEGEGTVKRTRRKQQRAHSRCEWHDGQAKNMKPTKDDNRTKTYSAKNCLALCTQVCVTGLIFRTFSIWERLL